MNPRRGQRVHPPQRAPRRDRGDGGASRALHPGRRRHPGAAAVAGIGATPLLAMLHALVQAAPRVRSGGCTVRATAPSTCSRPRCAPCWRSCPTSGAASSTVPRPPPTGWGRTTRTAVGWGRRRRRSGGPERCGCLCLRAERVHGGRDLGTDPNWGGSGPPAHRGLRRRRRRSPPGSLPGPAPAPSARRRAGPGSGGHLRAGGPHGAVAERLGSLLELAEACDVPARWSCRTGVCHTCEAGLLGGAVSYDPQPVDPPAAATSWCVVPVPGEDVVIDL